ncbi:hypothetical protein [Neobacillus vireti]|uniref:Uncharacterized protein n=1 Tax=Neobacillus vireti LMG 21834 TaxID=1131730 RepID=A0AB94IQS4_9BACI|nr:hypothetical protein [Neobacillus vireti]ETI69451.1 hypothetical protein BAVI_07731 [Neobacillus vireti LMG 21834]KLT18917.1 hypothetical protein AA980_06190 [Neobacillus vireti]
MLNKVANALEMRGFLVKPIDNYIYFSLGNSKEELAKLEELLDSLKLNIKIEGNKIFINDDCVDQDTLNKIIWYHTRNHETNGGNGWYSWRYFIKRNHGPKINTFVLETGVALLVKAISAAGMVTDCSCDGHGRRAPMISFCGKYNAAWFHLLYQKHFKQIAFHYEWFLKNPESRSIHLTARSSNGKWDLNYVLEDTMLMARYFLHESQKLSRIKKEIFKGNYKTKRKMVKEMDFDELSGWMKKKYEVYLDKEREINGFQELG